MNIHSWAQPPAVGPFWPSAPTRPTNATPSSGRRLKRSPRAAFSTRRSPTSPASAGVAAGTVYLYFRGKDDLLISIFERTMNDAIAAGRESVAAKRGRGRTAARDRPSAPRSPRSRSQPGGGVSGRAAAVHEIHGAVLRDLPARIPGHHPRRDRPRSGTGGASVKRDQSDAGRKDVLRRARRNGNQLDPESAQILRSPPRRTPWSTSSWGGSANDAGTFARSPCSARERWARRLPPTLPTPVCRRCCSTSRGRPRAKD